MEESNLIPPSILEKLKQSLARDSDNYGRILCFLARNPRYIQIWEATLDNYAAFQVVLGNIIADMMLPENERKFEEVINDIENRSLEQSAEQSGDAQGVDLSLILENRSRVVNITAYNLTKIVSTAPPEIQAELMDVALQVSLVFLNNAQALAVTDATHALMRRTAPNVIIAIQVCVEVYQHIHMWWRGEISGKRCAKNIIDSCSSIAGGIAGGFAGGYAGQIFSVWGLLIGSIVGGLAGCTISAVISDRLTQKIFNLPKSVVLENAYCFLDLSPTASNDDVNRKFRQLALIHHPDRPEGSNEQFQLLQCYVCIIKASRESKITDDKPRAITT